MHRILVRSAELNNLFRQQFTDQTSPNHHKLLKKRVDEILFSLPMIQLNITCTKPTENKTLEDCLNVLKWLETFRNFEENWCELDSQEAIFYALSVRFKVYKPYEALCRVGELPTDIFYILEGKIAVTNLNNVIFNSDILEGNVFHNEGKGACLGETSILYNSNR